MEEKLSEEEPSTREPGGPGLAASGRPPPASETDAAVWPRGAMLLLFGLMVLLGFGARFYALGTGELWTDEAFTALLSRQDSGEILRITALDVHPPLYYLVLHALQRGLGPLSEWGLRLPSALAGCLALLVAIGYFSRRATPSAALLAVALLAFNPLHLFCAQEGRMYALTVLLGLLLAEAYARWQETGHQRALAALLVIEVLLLYTHYFTVFLVLGLNLDALLCPVRPRRDWLASQGLVGLALLPWLAYALPLKLASGYTGNEWRLPITLLDSIPNVLGVGAIWLDGKYAFSGTHAYWWLPWSLVALGFWWRTPAQKEGFRRGMLILAPALVICAVLQPLTREIHWLARYLLFSSPWLYLLVGETVHALLRRVTPNLRRVVVLALMTLALSGGLGYVTGPRSTFFRPLVERLPAGSSRHLLVSFSDGWVLAYYLQQVGKEGRTHWVLLEPGNIYSRCEPDWTLEKSLARNALGGPLGATPEDVIAAVRAPGGPDFVWVVVDQYTLQHSHVAPPFLEELARGREVEKLPVHPQRAFGLLLYRRPGLPLEG